MGLASKIKIENITKFFIEKTSKKKIEVFDNFSMNLPIENGNKIISIVGKSGSGKTTLLRMIAGLETPNLGQITVNGIIANKPTLQTTLIPQSFTCFPWLNVYQNIAFGLEVLKQKNIKEKVVNVATQLGLQDRLSALPNELSGGMQQRVAVGRALAVDVPIILMDEPFSSLDTITRKEMQEIILKITEQEERLIILVTHDLHEAILLSDDIIILPERSIHMPTEIIHIPFDRPRNSYLIGDSKYIDIHKRLSSKI